MKKIDMPVKANTIAVLKNVTSCMVLAQTLIDRPANLPGLGVFSGPSGDGKTTAAQYAQNRLNAVYIEARHFWTPKTFCEVLLNEISGVTPRGTMASLMNEIISRFGDMPNRLLIIDEADKLVDRGSIELVRDIYDTTLVPILLLGEERLPQKLALYERVHNRVLNWSLTQPCDLEDTRALSMITCPNITITDDLLNKVRTASGGRAGRIATTLHEVANFARNHGLGELSAKTYEGRFVTGETPKRHKGVA